MRKLSILLAGTIMAGLTFSSALANPTIEAIEQKYETIKEERLQRCSERNVEDIYRCMNGIFLVQKHTNSDGKISHYIDIRNSYDGRYPYLSLSVQDGVGRAVILTDEVSSKTTDVLLEFELSEGLSIKTKGKHASDGYGMSMFWLNTPESERLIEMLLTSDQQSLTIVSTGDVHFAAFISVRGLDKAITDLLYIKNTQ